MVFLRDGEHGDHLPFNEVPFDILIALRDIVSIQAIQLCGGDVGAVKLLGLFRHGGRVVVV